MGIDFRELPTGISQVEKSDMYRRCSQPGSLREERENHIHAGATLNTPWLEQTYRKNIKEAGKVGSQQANHPEGTRGYKEGLLAVLYFGNTLLLVVAVWKIICGGYKNVMMNKTYGITIKAVYIRRLFKFQLWGKNVFYSL